MRGGEDLLVVGLGPVGLAASMIGRLLGARRVIGIEARAERSAFALDGGFVDEVVPAAAESGEQVLALTGGKGCEVAVDCSGSTPGRLAALTGAAEWGRVSLLGEGGRLEAEVSDLMLHKQLTIFASWVTSLRGMERVARLFAEANRHPSEIVSDRFALDDADAAYRAAASGAAGKVVLVPSL